MQAGTLKVSDVQMFTSRVLVNGVQRPHLSWSVSREITSDLPEQVVGGGGVTQATGSIEWADASDVSNGTLNPWNPSTGWIPREGDRVQIFAGDGVDEWSQFVGVIDSSSGSIGGDFASKIVDRIDDLSELVNVPALMTGMPPLTDTGTWRRVGVSSLFYLDSALRAGGFYTTPKAEFGAVLVAPFQGSRWPLIGSVVSCVRLSNSSQAPPADSAPWGSSSYDMTALYRPSTARPASTPVQLTMLRAPAHNGIAQLRAIYGSNSVELRFSATQVLGYVNGALVASITASTFTTAQLLYKDGTLTLKTDTGLTGTGTAAIGTTGLMTSILVSADASARIAGIQVSHPTASNHEFASIGWRPSASINVGLMHTGSLALPAVNNTPAIDLISDIGEKMLRAFWIDELGVARIVASDRLYESPPVQTVTTLDDVRSLDWERSLLGARSRVRVTYENPTITSRSVSSVEVWSASESIVLGTGDQHEVVIEPPSGEDWVLVDASPLILGLTYYTELNKGIRSFIGGVYTNGVEEKLASANDVQKLDVSMTSLGASKWALKFTAKTMEAGWQVELRTMSPEFVGATGLFPYWWGRELPIIRAKAKVTWDQRERTPSIAGTIGPVLTHDCGPWATAGGDDTSVIDAIGSFIAEQVTQPRSTITGLRVGFDPRRQLGDVIIIGSPNFLGVNLKCLIVGIDNEASGHFTQSLKVRVISVETTYTTYDQFAAAWGNTANYDSFAAAWGSVATYDDFNEDPLKGTY